MNYLKKSGLLFLLIFCLWGSSWAYPPILLGTINTPPEFCINTAPGPFISQQPTGGTGVYTYQWQSFTNSSGFKDVPGANALIYQPTILTSDYLGYRLIVTSGGTTVNSILYYLKISGELNPGTVSSSQNLCYNTIPIRITSTTASGADGYSYNPIYYFKWQSSPDSLLWADIVAANTSSYIPPALTQTTYYRKKVWNNNCAAKFTNIISIIVAPDFIPGTIGNKQSICYNTSPVGINDITSNMATSYEWYTSTDSLSYTLLPGATGKSLNPGNSTHTTYYKRQDKNLCGNGYTNSVKVFVLPELVAGPSNPISQLICYKSLPFSLQGGLPSGGNGIYSYQWYASDDQLVRTAISGATGQDYQAPVLFRTVYFSRVTSTYTCPEKPSDWIKIGVQDKIISGIPPPSQEIAFNTQANTLAYSAPSGGSGFYTYQWQSSVNDTLFIDLPGVTSDLYKPPLLKQTNFYRIKTFSGTCGPSISVPVKIKIFDQLHGGFLPVQQNVCYAASLQITGTSSNGGGGGYQYQWQSSTDTITWMDVTGIAAIYDNASCTQSAFFRRRVIGTSSHDTAYSSVQSILLYQALNSGTISFPKSALVDSTCSGNLLGTVISGTLAIGGTGGYNYTWESASDGISWTASPFTGQNLSPSIVIQQDTYFRRNTTDKICQTSAFSNPVKYMVLKPLLNGAAPGPQIVCYNTTSNPIIFAPVTGGDGKYVYQWQSSKDSLNWSSILEGNLAAYQAPPATEKKWYRRKTASFNCIEQISESIKIDILPIFNPGILTGDQSICSKDTASKIMGTLPLGGGQPYIFEWESGTDSIHFKPITGANYQNYAPGQIFQNMYYRRRAFGGTCTSAFTNKILLTALEPVLSGHVLASDTNVCFGTSGFNLTTDLAPSGGDQVFTYQWQKSTDGKQWLNMAGADAAHYQPLDFKTLTYYRKIVITACGNFFSNVVKVNMKSALDPGQISGSQDLGKGQIPALISGAPASSVDGGFVYQWQSSVDSLTWKNIVAFGIGKDFQPGAINTSTYFKRTVTTGCGTGGSNVVKIWVYPVLIPGTIAPQFQTVCYRGMSQKLSGTNATGGGGNYLYQWQQSIDSLNWTDLKAEVYRDYTLPKPNVTTYFRRKDQTLYYPALPTAVASVHVTPGFSAPVPISNPINCKNSNVTLQISAPNPDLNYQWTDQQFGILGNGSTYTYKNILQNTMLHVAALDTKGCSSEYSDIVLQIDSIKASFTSRQTTVENGQAIQFFSTSTNAKSFSWNFYEGDIMTNAAPVHFYNSTGTKDIQLIVKSSIGCTDTLIVQDAVNITPSTTSGTMELKTTDLALTAFPVPFENQLTLVMSNYTLPFQLKIVNYLGQNIYNPDHFNWLETIATSDWPPGIYQLILFNNKTIKSIKIEKY